MADTGTEFELGEIVLILGAVIIIGYFVYQAVSGGAAAIIAAIQSVLAIPGNIIAAISTTASDLASGNPGSGGTGEGGVFGTTGSSDLDWTAG